MTEEYNAGKQALSENVEARVKITDCIYPGTKLSFGDTEYRIRIKRYTASMLSREQM